MGDKDFIKPLLERRGTVYFGKVGRRWCRKWARVCRLIVRRQWIPITWDLHAVIVPPAGEDEARQAADLCQGAGAGAEQASTPSGTPSSEL